MGWSARAGFSGTLNGCFLDIFSLDWDIFSYSLRIRSTSFYFPSLYFEATYSSVYSKSVGLTQSESNNSPLI